MIAEPLGCGFEVLAWKPTQFKGSATPSKEMSDLELILGDKKSVEWAETIPLATAKELQSYH